MAHTELVFVRVGLEDLMTDKEIALEMTIALIAKDQYVSAVDAAKVFQLLHKVVSDPTITITEGLWPKG